MKKVIILLAAILPLLSFAQTDGFIEPDGNGYTFTFNTTGNDYAFVGWAPGCDEDNTDKTYLAQGCRVGELNISTTGEQQSWEHVELIFPDALALGSETLDLSSEEDQYIEVTFSATDDAEVMILFADATTIHPDPAKAWQLAADNVPAIQHTYSASDGLVTITNNDDTFSGNNSDEGAFAWSVFESDPELQAAGPINIDSTAITEVWIYYRLGAGIEPECNGSERNVNGVLTIKSLRIGSSVFTAGPTDPIVSGDQCLVGINGFLTELKKINLYPNPIASNSTLKFEQELHNISIQNMQGMILQKLRAGESIDLDIDPGVYILSCDEGYQTIVVE